ncbi:MAG: AcrR family transcriptional regulator [Granulosicoccus sp.]|jgi:AcrR family transcriptional regulator
MMGRRSDHSREELQGLIIEATLVLVREHGADKVTARQIAKSIGYTPGTLYSVFINLQDIFLHVTEIGLKDLFNLCDTAIEDENDPYSAINALANAYLKFATEHMHQFDLMFARSAPKAESTPAAIRNRIGSIFELIEIQLSKLNPDANTSNIKLGARALWSGIHGLAMLRLSDQLYLDPTSDDKDVVETLVFNFLNSWKQQ